MPSESATGSVGRTRFNGVPSWSTVQEFLQYPERRYLFGATAAAAEICRELPIVAIVDDCWSQSMFGNVPVIRLSQVPPDSLVVATQLGRPASAAVALTAAGLQHTDFFSFSRYSGLKLPAVRFWSGFTDQTAAHLTELAALRCRLADPLSVEVLDRLVQFRLHADLSALQGFTDRQAQQYFEDFLELRQDGEVFADVGGYDGATTAQFLQFCPGAAHCWCFEPHPQNLRQIETRFQNDHRVHVVGAALGEQAGTATLEGHGSVDRQSTRLNSSHT